MIQFRFGDLPGLGLLYTTPDVENALAFFPGLNWEVDTTVQVLNEIERAYDADIAANPWVLERRHIPGAEFKTFRAREMWRVASYVMFTTTLEGVINKRYEYLLSMVGQWDAAVRTTQEALHVQPRLDRKAEMKPLFAVRNKVFAHTAWASPHRDDSPDVQTASLQYFAGGGASFSDDGMHFGGYYLGENGEDSDKLPRMSMRWLIDNYPPHLVGWHRMYVDVCERLQAIPDETIKKWAPHVHTVIGRPGAETPPTNAQAS